MATLAKEHTHPGYYNAAGERIPNVTTIAKLIQAPEGLIHWAWDLGTKGQDYRAVRDDAATAGHACHAMIECAIKGQTFVPADMDEETLGLATQGFRAFQSWLASANFALIRTEVVVVSERYQYGGRLDCIATVNGEPCIVDWKTSKKSSPMPAWLPQVAAYRQAWNETHRGEQVKACHLMQLRKADAGFSHHYLPPETMDLGFRAFLACLELYDLRKQVEKLF